MLWPRSRKLAELFDSSTQRLRQLQPSHPEARYLEARCLAARICDMRSCNAAPDALEAGLICAQVMLACTPYNLLWPVGPCIVGLTDSPVRLRDHHASVLECQELSCRVPPCPQVPSRCMWCRASAYLRCTSLAPLQEARSQHWTAMLADLQLRRRRTCCGHRHRATAVLWVRLCAVAAAAAAGSSCALWWIELVADHAKLLQ